MARCNIMRGSSILMVVTVVVVVYLAVMLLSFYTSNPLVSALKSQGQTDNASVTNNNNVSGVSPDKNKGSTFFSLVKKLSPKASPDKGPSPSNPNASENKKPTSDNTNLFPPNSVEKAIPYDIPVKIPFQTVFKVNNYTIVRRPTLNYVAYPSLSGHNSKIPKNISQLTDLPYNPTLENVNVTDAIYKDDIANTTSKDGNGFKIILYWNDYFGKNGYGFGLGRKPFLLAGCRVNTCVITDDRNRYPLKEVDAIMWNVRSKDKSLPPERHPNNKYVFCAQDAPTNNTDLTKYKDVFNMTFTYRRDSDIYAPLSRVFRRRTPLPNPPVPVNHAKGKTNLVAWFFSYCKQKSMMNDLLKKLHEFMAVDTYGECGTLKCENDKEEDCLEMIEKKYKFIFVFEDSVCLDYASPKFFNVLNHDIVPVVWGFGNYTQIVPTHSYINAFDFPSAYYLADYLRYLDTNDTAYNEYFWWKPYYYQLDGWLSGSIAWCDLCEQLHKKDPIPKTYDINQWFREDSHCMNVSNNIIHRYVYIYPGS